MRCAQDGLWWLLGDERARLQQEGKMYLLRSQVEFARRQLEVARCQLTDVGRLESAKGHLEAAKGELKSAKRLTCFARFALLLLKSARSPPAAEGTHQSLLESARSPPAGEGTHQSGGQKKRRRARKDRIRGMATHPF